jgi:hypothetical protein
MEPRPAVPVACQQPPRRTARPCGSQVPALPGTAVREAAVAVREPTVARRGRLWAGPGMAATSW